MLLGLGGREDLGQRREQHLALLGLRLHGPLCAHGLISHHPLGDCLHTLRRTRCEIHPLLSSLVIVATNPVTLFDERLFERHSAGVGGLNRLLEHSAHLGSVRGAVIVSAAVNDDGVSLPVHGTPSRAGTLFVFSLLGPADLLESRVVLRDDEGDLLPHLLAADVDRAELELHAALTGLGHRLEELSNQVFLGGLRVDGAKTDRDAVLPAPHAELGAGRELRCLRVELRRRGSAERVRVLAEEVGRPTTANSAPDAGRGSEGRDVRVVQPADGVLDVVLVLVVASRAVFVVIVQLCDRRGSQSGSATHRTRQSCCLLQFLKRGRGGSLLLRWRHGSHLRPSCNPGATRGEAPEPQCSYVVDMSSRISLWGRAVAQRPPVRRTTPPPTKAEPPPPPPPEPEVKFTPAPQPTRKAEPTSVYHTPDAWPRKFAETPQRREEPARNPVGRPRMKAEQRRRNTISIALSEEEESYIREAAAERGISISEWARLAFFKYLGRKVPTRDMRRRDWSKGPEPKDE